MSATQMHFCTPQLIIADLVEEDGRRAAQQMRQTDRLLERQLPLSY